MSNEIHILVVDDNLINRQYFSMSLTKSGYKVTSVESGFEAIKVAKSLTFNLILMDIRMSDMDGYETADNIRQITQYKHVPILATSAENISKESQKSFNGFLLKPIRPKQLSDIVKKYCGDLNQPLAQIFNHESALKYAYNDDQILQKLINLFIKDLPIQLSLLNQLIQQLDYQACQEIIHKIKGSCSTCGAEVLDYQINNLAQVIKNKQYINIDKSMQNIEKAANDYLVNIGKN